MNDSFGRISSPTPTSNVGGSRGQTVQILSLPKTLSNSAKAFRIEGQITQITNDGQARITTPEGDVEIKVRGSKQPQLGQRIELDVQAGSQKRQAIIREAPQQSSADRIRNPNITRPSSDPLPHQTVITNPRITSPVPGNTPQNTQQSSTTVSATNTPTPNAPATTTIKQPAIPTSLQEAATSQQTSANATTQQGRPLPIDAIVRLLSVPPAQSQTIATEFLQNLPPAQSAIITKTAFTANLIAQNVQNTLQAPLLQAPQNNFTQPLNTPPSTTQNIIQNSAQPLANNSFFAPIVPPSVSLPQETLATQPLLQTQAQINITPPPTATTQPIGLLAGQQNNIIPNNIQVIRNSNNIVIPSGQTLPITSAKEILNTPAPNITTSPTPNNVQPPHNASLLPLPIGFNPNIPATLTTSRANVIDIQIIKISPPVTNITPVIIPTSKTTDINTVPATTQFTPPVISNNTAATITAQVTGFTNAGLPLVTTQLPGTTIPQSFILQFKSSNLQLGSQLQITPQTSQPPVSPVINSARQININNLLQGFQWPALDELYQTLSQLNPQAAASLTRSLPHAGTPSQMSAAAMIFIAAIKSGDLANFLGTNKMDALEKAGKSDILSKLTQRPTGSGQATTIEAASSNDWRAVPLPMFWEGEIHKIMLYTRKENQSQQEQNNGNVQTRFVFDLTLSRMGEVQLDGLLRDKRLDLMVRTQNAFSEPMQQTMRQAYTSALNQTELSGELNFQGSTKNWVHVLEQKEELGVHV